MRRRLGALVSTPEQRLAADLLGSLQDRLDEPGLEFAEPLVALHGGFDTRIFSFRLRGAPPDFSRPLVLRLLAPHHDRTRARREQAIQNAVAAQGYPAPRVLLSSTDAALLGGAWLVMERVAGETLIKAQPVNMSRVLVEWQRRLHALDASALLRAIQREDGSSHAVTVDGLLSQLGARVAHTAVPGLEGAMAWLTAHRPPERHPVICHGDFHPHNILVSGGAVTGVLDWPNAVVADPEYDVAATRVILSFTPIELSALPATLRWMARVFRRVMVTRYLARYQRAHPLDQRALRYYEALACMRGLVRAAEGRLRTAAALSELDASSYGDALAGHFFRITGIPPALPPARRSPA
ncbi:MAG: hypothetical protein C5B48_11560 [Candidatus Rokuibacteriota bacterium]|nr:MAG: hypothetical protein C5B48_11560 [Candidatus Rokubacteria bacterium]